MFEKQSPVFFYTVSPVHMGAGSAVGVIDNPIQREKHSDHPVFAGSGLKGALRHSFKALGGDERLIGRLFGPEPGANTSLHAGAVSFGDAQLVAFPVRSLREGFVYATSPYALSRLHRLLSLCQQPPAWTPPPAIPEGTAVVLNDQLLSRDDQLHLELFQYQRDNAVSDLMQPIATWLAEAAMPQGDSYAFFRNKIKRDLVLLSEEDFKYFVQNATSVEPHVRINAATGTADDGGLFYTENLPPESLLVAPLLASKERAPDDARNGEQSLLADEVLSKIVSALRARGGLIQVGGDATTGRGLVVTTVLEG